MRLKERWSTIIATSVQEHAGRIIKTMGDGLLVEFPSAVNAAAGALNIQARMRTRRTASVSWAR